MDKPPHDTLVPQRRGVGRWPVTLTTERANPLCQWNPDWGGCSTARRPVAAVNVFFLRRSVFVKRFTHEMTMREVPAVRRGRPGAMQPTELRSRAQPGCATRIGHLTAYAATGDRPRTRSHSRSSGAPPTAGTQATERRPKLAPLETHTRSASLRVRGALQLLSLQVITVNRRHRRALPAPRAKAAPTRRTASRAGH